MATERTFSIIKPDATRRNLTGAITKMLEEAGLRVVASKRIQMTREQAEGFYGVHRERPFFNDLVTFMISGPVVVQVLEGENAVARNREVMGATNPANAEPARSARNSPNRSKPIQRPRLRQRRECGDRDRLLLQARRNRRLTGRACAPPPAPARQRLGRVARPDPHPRLREHRPVVELLVTTCTEQPPYSSPASSARRCVSRPL
jgi:nucleoside-diphosphate kinase